MATGRSFPAGSCAIYPRSVGIRRSARLAGLVARCMMLAENKTIGRNRKGMKVEYEFYRKDKAFEFLPRVTFWWDRGWYDMEISWLRWGIDIQILRRNNACR